MKRIAKVLFAGIVVVSGLTVGLYFSGCGKSKPNSTCCDDSSLGYCNCYENKVCTSGDRTVSSCPNYGHCCQDQDMADFCTCWDLTCSDTIGYSTEVSSCP
jgi:hypothetical protein